MPAQAGIQGPQAQASGESSWIPAFAGMTSPSLSPQTYSSSPQPNQLSSLDEAQRNSGKTSEAESRIALRSIRATELSNTATTPRRFRWWQVLLLVVVLVLGGGLAANWRLVRLVAASYFPPPVPAPIALPLPDKPSIVVLPFVNLSGDSSQEYFSDGLTDEITSNLSRLNSLFVIARTSAFTYKGKAAKVQDIGRELGVRYVLEGSVQKLKDQIRIRTQLIDATNGGHLWTEHYERPLADIFAVQDEIVRQIVTTLKLQFTAWRLGESVRKRTPSMEAYDLVLRSVEHFWRLTKDDLLQSRKLLEQALTLDPQYAHATQLLGGTYFFEWWFKWNANPHTLDRAWEFMQKAIILDDLLPVGHSFLALLYEKTGQIDHAIPEIERAIALEPNNADTYQMQSEILVSAGRPTEGLQAARRALRLNPHGSPIYHMDLAWAYQVTERYDESIAALKHAIARSPLWIHAHAIQAGNYVALWGFRQNQDSKTLAQAYAAAQNAIAVNNAHPLAHVALGNVYLWQKRYDDAITEFERAVALDEKFVFGQMMLACGLSQVGRAEEAVQVGERALSLKALPSDDRWLFGVVSAYALAGRLEEAAALSQRLLKQFPNLLLSYLQLADIYSQLGREAEAQAAAAEVLRINPQFSLEVYKQRVPIKDPTMLERHIAALHKAGLK